MATFAASGQQAIPAARSRLIGGEMSCTKWLCTIGIVLFSTCADRVSAVAQQIAFMVPYAEAINLDKTLKVMLGFGAAPLRVFAVDTGSVGIVVPRSELPTTVKRAVAGIYSLHQFRVGGEWLLDRTRIGHACPDGQSDDTVEDGGDSTNGMFRSIWKTPANLMDTAY
jgi:hypothetical protein